MDLSQKTKTKKQKNKKQSDTGGRLCFLRYGTCDSFTNNLPISRYVWTFMFDIQKENSFWNAWNINMVDLTTRLPN